jgi:hypothetical protein
MKMAFDIPNTTHQETKFTIRKGPFKTDDGEMFIWAEVEAIFHTPQGPSPSVSVFVPVAINDDMSFAEIRAAVFASVKSLLNHSQLPVACSAERSAQL